MTPNLGVDVDEMEVVERRGSPRWAWGAGFFALYSIGWKEPPAPVVFRWGFWGYILTKKIDLYTILRIYYFLICYAYENIEKIFIFFACFLKKSGTKKANYQITNCALLDKRQTNNYIDNNLLRGCNSITTRTRIKTMKEINLKAIIADIKSGIEKATEKEITKQKIVADITGFCVDLCNIKKVLADITDCINIDSATDNRLQIERIARLDIATSNLQDCIESLVVFCNDNK